MSIGRNVPAVTVDAVPLQWANSKAVARNTPDGRFNSFVGFHIEIGKDEELDRRLQAMRTPRIEIKHQRQGGFEIKPHWSLGETVRFYPVTSGPPADTVSGCLRATRESAAAGIGVHWPQGERSRMAVRGYVDILIAAGYVQPVQLATRSRMTDVLMACLVDHYRVCAAADKLIDRNRHPDEVAFHEVALPLMAGEEAEWGKGDTATVVPFRSDHPPEIDAAYLRTVWRQDGIHAAALRDWASITAWAADYCAGAELSQHPEEVL